MRKKEENKIQDSRVNKLQCRCRPLLATNTVCACVCLLSPEIKWTPAASRLNMYRGFKNVYMENTNPIDIINSAKHANDAWVLVKSNRSVEIKAENRKKKERKRKKWGKLKIITVYYGWVCFSFGRAAHRISAYSIRHTKSCRYSVLSTGERFNVMAVIYSNNNINHEHNMLCTYAPQKPLLFAYCLQTILRKCMIKKAAKIKLIRSLRMRQV